MSFSITASFVEQFSRTVHHLVQQKQARLRDAVSIQNGVVGKSAHFDRLDNSDPVPTTRHGDTYLANDIHDRVTCYLADYQKGLLVDRLDKVKLLINPENAYTQNISYAFARLFDRVAYDGLDAESDKDQYGDNLADANGLTFDLVRDLKKFFDSIEAPDGERYIGYTAETINPLLADSNLTSSDYNTVKVLVEGSMPKEATWMGFKWRRFNSSHVTQPATNFHSLYAWCKPSIGVAVGKDMELSIDKRPDKQNAYQVLGLMSLGAVMIEPEAVAYMNVASNK